MQMKRVPIVLLAFLCLMIVPIVAQATTITSCTLDKDTYHQGETGFVTVTIYNDNDNKIRVTELTATIDYYYTDGNVYIQKFYTNVTLPAEIGQGNSSNFQIPFSLPTNIASGFARADIKAITEIWNVQAERWYASEHPAYQLKLFVESPYKDQLDEQIIVNGQLQEQLDEQTTAKEQLQEQLEEQLSINENTTTMMYLFVVTTVVFAAVAGFLFLLYRRARFIAQPLA